MAVKLTSLIGKALLARQGRRFMGNEDGVTAIEFGLLAIPFFSIITAILETSLVFLGGQLLDSGVQDASRLIRTGQAQAANYTMTEFRKALCGNLLSLFNCDGLHIEVKTLNSFNAATISAPIDFSCKTAATCVWRSDRPEVYTSGAGSSIMVVQVYYKWPVLLNFANISFANLATSERVMGAATVFRNEPFS